MNRGHSLSSHLAALGWVPTAGRAAGVQLALPIDLFMVTVHAGEGASAGGPALELVVTLLRTRPERFRSRSAGILAYALLTPAGLLALLRAPLHGAADLRVPLAEFCAPAELGRLRDGLLDAADPQSRMLLFGAWVENRIKQRHGFGARQQRVAEAAQLIQQQGSPGLAGLRGELLISQRQLEREFRFWLGVTPALYARNVRFQRAAAALASGGELSATAMGHAFADQSHMNRVFRQLSSLTPREFARRSGGPQRHAARHALAGRVVVLDAAPGS